MLNTKQILLEMNRDLTKTEGRIDRGDFADAALSLGRLTGYCLLLQQMVATKSMNKTVDHSKS